MVQSIVTESCFWFKTSANFYCFLDAGAREKNERGNTISSDVKHELKGGNEDHSAGHETLLYNKVKGDSFF